MAWGRCSWMKEIFLRIIKEAQLKGSWIVWAWGKVHFLWNDCMLLRIACMQHLFQVQSLYVATCYVVCLPETVAHTSCLIMETAQIYPNPQVHCCTDMVCCVDEAAATVTRFQLQPCGSCFMSSQFVTEKSGMEVVLESCIAGVG